MLKAALVTFEDGANWVYSQLDRFLDGAWTWIDNREKK